MKLKIKNVEDIVISLTAEEAAKLKRILCHSGAIWEDPAILCYGNDSIADACEAFSLKLWMDLDDLEVEEFTT